MTITLILPVSAQDSVLVTEYDAIKIAEQFVIDNGYTSHPPDTAKVKLESLSLLDKNVSIKERLKNRFDTLIPEADHAFKSSEIDSSYHWFVLFKQTENNCPGKNTECMENLKNQYRVVRMNEYGGEVILMHTPMVVTIETEILK